MENNTGSLLTISSEIISNESDGFTIELYNDETEKTTTVDSVDSYADYLIDNVNKSKCNEFKAIWLPSPNARRIDIDVIGMKLGMIQERFEKEIKKEEKQA